MSSSNSVYATQVLQTPSVHGLSVSQFFDVSWNYLLDNISLAASYGPTHHIAEYIVTNLLLRVKHGQLRIVTPTGKILLFPAKYSKILNGDDNHNLTATLVVRRDSFWTRVAIGTDMGLAEAFMGGDVDCDDVSALLKFFIVNRPYISTPSTTASRLFSIPKFVTQSRFIGSIGNARANISAHYDLGNVLFESFLSSEMIYSCPIYSHANSEEKLEAAQDRKLRRLIQKAQVRPGHRVLDLGCGWGGLSILIAQMYPSCQVDAITLSVHQHTHAQDKVCEAGLSDRVTVHLMDYREIKSLPDWHHAFDRVISCEMVEAIGKDYMEMYWDTMDWALNVADGVGVIQGITLPEARVAAYDRSVDFIQKWIFPGSYIPSLEFLISTLSTGTDGRLTVDSVENIGPANYPRALAAWRTQFLANFDSKIKPALQKAYNLGPEDLETFRRKWIWYFGYCEQGFSARMIGCHIIAFTREANTAFVSSH
ncbi:hypothetical protein FRB93_005695 [Tulasnella sp. JGI-2019a]|nr:hypothetical protein FRB93_005695 [Tulasnella sp. JGI-2019a]